MSSACSRNYVCYSTFLYDGVLYYFRQMVALLLLLPVISCCVATFANTGPQRYRVSRVLRERNTKKKRTRVDDVVNEVDPAFLSSCVALVIIVVTHNSVGKYFTIKLNTKRYML